MSPRECRLMIRERGINKETGRQVWSVGPDLVFVFYPDNIISRQKFLSHKLHNLCNLDSLLLGSLWMAHPDRVSRKKVKKRKSINLFTLLATVQVVILFLEIVHSGLKLNSQTGISYVLIIKWNSFAVKLYSIYSIYYCIILWILTIKTILVKFIHWKKIWNTFTLYFD